MDQGCNYNCYLHKDHSKDLLYQFQITQKFCLELQKIVLIFFNTVAETIIVTLKLMELILLKQFLRSFTMQGERQFLYRIWN